MLITLLHNIHARCYKSLLMNKRTRRKAARKTWRDPLAFGVIKYDDVADYVLIYSFGTRWASRRFYSGVDIYREWHLVYRIQLSLGVAPDSDAQKSAGARDSRKSATEREKQNGITRRVNNCGSARRKQMDFLSRFITGTASLRAKNRRVDIERRLLY